MTVRHLLGVATALLLASGFGTSQQKQDDKDQLQGEWTMVSLESPGKKVDEDVIKKSKLAVKGNEWVTTLNGTELKFTFKSDPAKSPKQVDLLTDRTGKEMSWPGIYKIEGETLTFCRASGPGGERPKELKAGEGVVLIVYKRATK